MSGGVLTREQGCKRLESLLYARFCMCFGHARAWVGRGASDEIRTLPNRVLLMLDGEIKGELPGDAGERKIGLLMSGVREEMMV